MKKIFKNYTKLAKKFVKIDKVKKIDHKLRKKC